MGNGMPFNLPDAWQNVTYYFLLADERSEAQ